MLLKTKNSKDTIIYNSFSNYEPLFGSTLSPNGPPIEHTCTPPKFRHFFGCTGRWSVVILPYNHYFFIIWTHPLRWTNFNPLNLEIICTKFGWNQPKGFGEVENMKSIHQQRWRNIFDSENSLESLVEIS